MYISAQDVCPTDKPFRCNNGVCIKAEYRCDGMSWFFECDAWNDSDELNCSKSFFTKYKPCNFNGFT